MHSLSIVTFVLALLFPALPFATDQAQTPAPKAACCQMQGDHPGHGDGAGCCAEKAGDDACENCKDGKCGECCKDGACKDGCCKDGCCKHEEQPTEGRASCCQKAPKR